MSTPARRASRSSPPAVPGVLLGAALVVPLVLVLARYGLTAVYAVAAVVAVVVVVRLLRHDLVGPVRAAVAALRRWRRPRAAVAGTGTALPVRRQLGRPSTVVGLLVVGLAGAGAAWVVAHLGTKGLAAAAGGAAIVVLLLVTRDKTVFFTFAAVSSLVFVLHKSVGPQDTQLSGGAVSINSTSFDVLVLLLIGLWIWEGTFVADLRAAAGRPLVWLPLLGVLALLPSLLVAPSLGHAASELTRMGWMYLLYAYLAVRVRTRSQIWAVLAGLGVVAAVELVVVVLQWRTGGVLGLDFLGVPTSLGERTTDSESIGRPFGTIIHPVFMAAALGIIAMIALAVAIELERSLVTFAALGVTMACLACMWISQTRASFVAVGLSAGVVVLIGLLRGRIRWRTIGWSAVLVLVVAAAFSGKIVDKLSANFGTGHYEEEVQSRLELNDIALKMIGDHPLLGVGLNNFEVVLPRYEASPVIFFGHPVHNLYLLWLAEAGVLGFVGFCVVGIGLYDAAIRLGRSQDRLLAAVGTGSAAAMGFLMVEELLGFSLRQDIPLALYWVLAGLVAASSRLAGLRWPRREPRPAARTRASAPRPGPRAPVRAGRRVAASVLVTVLLVHGAVLVSTTVAAPAAAAAPARPGMTFTAVDRTTGVQGIYVAEADGTKARRITPTDGRSYNWPRFAFGNTKIVFTVRSGGPDSAEDIAIMNPDGTRPQVLHHFTYRVAQPAIDPTGKYLIYTGRAPWFPLVALFRLDLTTDEISNLTAVSSTRGGFDADPFLTGDGSFIAFVENSPRTGAQIVRMRTDGTDRRTLTDRRYYNTDPVTSADRRLLAIASYRGPGRPTNGSDPDQFSSVRPQDWRVVVQRTDGGRRSERVLTRGGRCVDRPATDPCSIPEMSGYVPQFTPDGLGVTFTGALDSQTTCICFASTDGRTTRAVLASRELAIDWHSYPQPAGLPTSTQHIGTAARTSRLLVTRTETAKRNVVMTASADLSDQTVVPLPPGLNPLEARWGPDGRTIVFTALVPLGPRRAPHPAAPPGERRRAHLTLTDLDPVAANQREARRAGRGPVAEQQVFLRTPDGVVKQLTDAWTEDYRDGLPPGDARGSSHPRISPDGRSVVVTNTSTLTGESFLLRIDLRSGAVVNLTNGTAGAQETDDSDATFSPDGSRVAFTWTYGTDRGVYTMNARTGKDVAPMTTGEAGAAAPSWSRDGRLVAYLSTRSDGVSVLRAPLDGRRQVGPAVRVSAGHQPVLGPVVAPEGDRIAFLAPTGSVLGVFIVDSGSTSARALQPSPLYSVLSLDWR